MVITYNNQDNVCVAEKLSGTNSTTLINQTYQTSNPEDQCTMAFAYDKPFIIE